MLLVVSALSLVACFFYFNRGEFIERQAYFAMAMMALYLVVYILVPSKINGTSVHLGRLYEFIPFISLGAILFPGFNSESPQIVTQILGWLGLISVSIILCLFKIFEW
jgi:hypothetical protein